MDFMAKRSNDLLAMDTWGDIRNEDAILRPTVEIREAACEKVKQNSF
jgi:hypothetical protein